MGIRIIKQGGRLNGRVMWVCAMPDGTTMELTIGEITYFNRPPAAS